MNVPRNINTIRIEIPVEVQVLAELLADKRKPSAVVAQILVDVAASIMRGRATFLSPELAVLVPEASRKLRFERELKKNQAITVDGQRIDVALLHTSTLKSGFAGVFGNAQGFRAMGKDPATGGAILIGYYPTALEAAWARYVYYQKHDLIYGPWSEVYERRRARYPNESIHEAKEESAFEVGRSKHPSSVGIPEEFMTFFNGEMPIISKKSDVSDPTMAMDIASINARAAARMREIAAEKKTKAEAARAPKATQAGKLASPDELEAVDRKLAELDPESNGFRDCSDLTEDEIMANARVR
jgi:hypothetical protein